MFILDRQNCSLDFGPGVRYVINVADEYTPGAYEVSVKELVSDIKKYPWLSGVTLIGKVNSQHNECVEMLEKLPRHHELRIEIFLPRDIFEKCELAKMASEIVYLMENKFKKVEEV